MTAVAMAESGGNSGAHNPHGEDSRGLWQINARAHPEFAGHDLYNPVENARAAFAVSHGGGDVSPWTTTHGGLSARYLRYRADAEAAASAYGDGNGHGMWEGTAGYKDHTPAGDSAGHSASHSGSHGSTPGGPSGTGGAGSDAVVVSNATEAPGQGTEPAHAGAEYGIPLEDGSGEPDGIAGTEGSSPAGGSALMGADYGIAPDPPAGASASPMAGAPDTAPHGTHGTHGTHGDSAALQRFLDAALAQTGDRYVFGAETNMNDPNPSAFDCSELVEWAAHQAGVQVTDGAWAQYSSLHGEGSAIPVEEAIKTPGALLFSFSSDPLTGRPKHAHVAISLGDGKTIEAMGDQYGVGSWQATPRRFQYAALIPGIADGDHAAAVDAQPPAAREQPDQPVDSFAYRLGADPAAMDSQPATLAASEQLTEAAPAHPEPPTDQPPPAEHVEPEPADHTADHTIGTDIDDDGVDDALAQATSHPEPPDQADQVDQHHTGVADDAFAAH